MEETKVIGTAVAHNTGNTYTTKLIIGKHNLIADEPAAVGGHELGPTPGDYLCMSLASCKAITLRMYAQRKQWEVGEIQVTVRMVKAEQEASGLNTFYCSVHFSAPLSEEQEKRLLEIAKRCPVDRLLQNPSATVTVIE
jgi:putative redox protein